jgi:uroporphyrinogen decarboxylase
MNKRERFHAAIFGAAVDRPPVTAWVHFLSDHLDGEVTADLHRRFLAAYDWDVLKVMNDYRYPMPAGVRTLEDPGSLRAFRVLGLDEPAFARQLACLRSLRASLGDAVPMVETAFDPYQQIMRNVGFDQAARIIEHRREALAAIETVAETTRDYIRAARAAGVDALFFSINGAIREGNPRGVSEEVHRTFQKPFDLAVLAAAEGMVRILHVHGAGIDLARVADYPYDVLSVSDRLAGNPTLADLRRFTDKCLMGGIDETRIQERSLPLIGAEIDDAIAQAGRQRLILSPGCTVPSFTSMRTLSFVREYTRSL